VVVLSFLGSGCKKGAIDAPPDARWNDASAQTPNEVSDAAADGAPEAASWAQASADAADDSEALTFSDKDPCVANCRKRSVQLKCGSPQACRESCTQLRSAKFCRLPARAFMACLMKAPRQQWICDDEGNPALVDAACMAERSGMLTCLQAHDGKL